MSKNQLGKTIQILRQANGLRLADVAKRTEVSVPFLSLVESGVRQPSLDVLNKIAKALSVPADVLLSAGCKEWPIGQGNKRAVRLSEAVGELINMEQQLKKILDKGH